jgi:hypothetical protein
MNRRDFLAKYGIDIWDELQKCVFAARIAVLGDKIREAEDNIEKWKQEKVQMEDAFGEFNG